MNSDREARKKALEAAKQRLAQRKKQKEQLAALRLQQQSAGSDNVRKNDYGKKLIEDTRGLINEWTTSREKQQEKLKQDAINNNNKQRNIQIVPGPRSDLQFEHKVNKIDLSKKSLVIYTKDVQTDAVQIAVDCGLININNNDDNDNDNGNGNGNNKQTTNDELNEILATFIQNDISPFPNKKDDIYKRIKSLNKDKDDKDKDDNNNNNNDDDDDNKDDNKDNNIDNDDNKIEIFLMNNDDALKLEQKIGFIDSFKKKSLIIQRALGINQEHSIFIEAHSTIQNIKENEQMEKLILLHEILPNNITYNRPITSLDYDNLTCNRFLASYSGLIYNGLNNNNNDDNNITKSDGLINIFDSSNYRILNSLECQSMINCAQFHPTKEYMIIGASVSGQVLGWDIRLNKKTPTIRTEFSSSCHTQPIFQLSFLTNYTELINKNIHNNNNNNNNNDDDDDNDDNDDDNDNNNDDDDDDDDNNTLQYSNPISKIKQVLTLSNDGKLCVWRDDILHEPNNEFLLKLSTKQSQSQSQSSSSSSSQAKEITTTCFTYSKLLSTSLTSPELYLGSDEGSIYSIQINLNKISDDDRELSITSYIPLAHYGPITCINFNNSLLHNYNNNLNYKSISCLYLTSSFDWTVKLWHKLYNKPISLFTQMQDYVYDVKWSPINPSIFATGDGSGNLTIFDLNNSFEHPASEPTNILSSNDKNKQIAITKILWSPNGKQIIVGDSSGKISVFDCPVYDVTDADFNNFESIIKRKLDAYDK